MLKARIPLTLWLSGIAASALYLKLQLNSSQGFSLFLLIAIMAAGYQFLFLPKKTKVEFNSHRQVVLKEEYWPNRIAKIRKARADLLSIEVLDTIAPGSEKKTISLFFQDNFELTIDFVNSPSDFKKTLSFLRSFAGLNARKLKLSQNSRRNAIAASLITIAAALTLLVALDYFSRHFVVSQFTELLSVTLVFVFIFPALYLNEDKRLVFAPLLLILTLVLARHAKPLEELLSIFQLVICVGVSLLALSRYKINLARSEVLALTNLSNYKLILLGAYTLIIGYFVLH